MKTRLTVGLALLLAWIAYVGVAAEQLASRETADWIKTLDAPERVAALKVNEVIARLKIAPGQSIADLGAGTGAFALPFATAVGPKGTVYAVEIDKGFLEEIDRKVDELHIATIETVLGTPTDPKLPTRAVDVALMHDVLHHVEQRQAYLKAVAGYMKPTGRIAVVEFNPKDSPHKAEPSLVVSKEQAAAWMADAGFVPANDVPLFPDKWFVIYKRR